MQLLDPLDTSYLQASAQRSLTALQDIAQSIQIESHFCIRHPAYQALEMPPEVVERFQHLPKELQQKLLNLQLRSFLYGTYYNGSLNQILAPHAETNALKFNQNLENNTVLGIDLGFYERLHNSNYGEGYFDPGWQILQQLDQNHFAVSKQGLTLQIEQEQHLSSDISSPQIGDLVEIRLPRNRVQNGFYMAVGNFNSTHAAFLKLSQQPILVRVYFNFTPEGAVAVMQHLTQELNRQSIPFDFKVLYNPADYHRSDSGVLYFEQSVYPAVRSTLQEIYTAHQSHFKPEIPLFTKLLAPGLGLAEEPDQKFSEHESFGLNRCQIVANGLLEAWYRGHTDPAERMESILSQFSLLGLSLERCHLNAKSEDIYAPLEL